MFKVRRWIAPLLMLIIVSTFLAACGKNADGPGTNLEDYVEPLVPGEEEDLSDKVEPLVPPEEEDYSDLVEPLERKKGQWVGTITFKRISSNWTEINYDPGFPVDLIAGKKNGEEIELTEVITLGEVKFRTDQGDNQISAVAEINGHAEMGSYSTMGSTDYCYGLSEASAETEIHLTEDLEVYIKEPAPGENTFTIGVTLPNERFFDKKEYERRFEFICEEYSEPEEVEKLVYEPSVYFERTIEATSESKDLDKLIGSIKTEEDGIITEISWDLEWEY